MGPRSTIRCVLWAFCLAIALFAARSAEAAAPVCDETASSRVAPPPILPIRDVKLEAAHPCDKAPAGRAPVAIVPVGPHVPSAPAVHYDGIANEAWMRPNDIFIAPPVASVLRDGASDSLPLAAGFSRSVFRPPRAAA